MDQFQHLGADNGLVHQLINTKMAIVVDYFSFSNCASRNLSFCLFFGAHDIHPRAPMGGYMCEADMSIHMRDTNEQIQAQDTRYTSCRLYTPTRYHMGYTS